MARHAVNLKPLVCHIDQILEEYVAIREKVTDADRTRLDEAVRKLSAVRSEVSTICPQNLFCPFELTDELDYRRIKNTLR